MILFILFNLAGSEPAGFFAELFDGVQGSDTTVMPPALLLITK
jgi:hypothetical protein